MAAVELTEGIYWVGAIDWELRTFHGFETPRGTTYNSYLIVDDTVTLVDTVKAQFAEQMMSRIAEVVDPASIDLIVANHVEMDHSSGLLPTFNVANDARLVASPKGAEGLEKYYQQGWDIETVKTGDEISIGKRTLKFVSAPMVHWPDSMFTYVVEDQVLLPNDAFGQHYASTERFDDEVWHDPDLMVVARDYFANIVLPYAPQVQRALASVAEQGIEPKIIGPSHGIVWRSHISDILAAYERWCAAEAEPRVVIVYDTMWGSTAKMARAIAAGVASGGVKVDIYKLGADPVARIMGEIMEAKAILIGGPTLNAGVYPTVAGFLTYMKGLRPRGKLWGAFGSYGWAPVGQKAMAETMQAMDGESLEERAVQFAPTGDESADLVSYGAEIAERVQDS